MSGGSADLVGTSGGGTNPIETSGGRIDPIETSGGSMDPAGTKSDAFLSQDCVFGLWIHWPGIYSSTSTRSTSDQIRWWEVAPSPVRFVVAKPGCVQLFFCQKEN